MTELAKEIRFLISKYVDRAGDPNLIAYWTKLQRGAGLNEDSAGGPAPPANTSTTGGARSEGEEPVRRRTTRKRRRTVNESPIRIPRRGSARTPAAVEIPSGGQNDTEQTVDDQPQLEQGPSRTTRQRTTPAVAAGATTTPCGELRRSKQPRKDRGQRS
ncbi:unnamed protein product [Phytophthora fragariaefolia]|uniref:Unnamed protein product n=1 Tax=Phytophthora fragariaefolia TaxID=1490495 RepID=A0A9W6WV85_9STRA|nr:unnamed protein product [Phytophthora fragariaefolia]